MMYALFTFEIFAHTKHLKKNNNIASVVLFLFSNIAKGFLNSIRVLFSVSIRKLYF